VVIVSNKVIEVYMLCLRSRSTHGYLQVSKQLGKLELRMLLWLLTYM